MQILFDFECMFDQIDPLALQEIWPLIESKPFTDFDIRIDEDDYPFGDEQLLNFIMWLRLFSFKRNNLKTLLGSFIVFCDVRELVLLFFF